MATIVTCDSCGREIKYPMSYNKTINGQELVITISARLRPYRVTGTYQEEFVVQPDYCLSCLGVEGDPF